MDDRIVGLLEDIRDNVAYIGEKIAGRTVDDYLTELDLRFIVERALIIIGEALAKIRDRDEATIRRIPDYKPAIGLRNILVHAYKDVDDRQIWETVIEFLPLMGLAVERILAEQDSEERDA